MKPLALGFKPRQPLEGKFAVVRIACMVEAPLGPGNEQFELRKSELFGFGVGVGAALEPAHFWFGCWHGYSFSSRLSHFLACERTFDGAVPP
jgi:hypothetical protein